MFWHLRRTSLVFVGVTLLAALVGGFLGDFVHTDDGCAFETHCLACQRSIRSVGALAPDLAPPPTLESVGSATRPAGRLGRLDSGPRRGAPRSSSGVEEDHATDRLDRSEVSLRRGGRAFILC